MIERILGVILTIGTVLAFIWLGWNSLIPWLCVAITLGFWIWLWRLENTIVGVKYFSPTGWSEPYQKSDGHYYVSREVEGPDADIKVVDEQRID